MFADLGCYVQKPMVDQLYQEVGLSCIVMGKVIQHVTGIHHHATNTGIVSTHREGVVNLKRSNRLITSYDAGVRANC
jgi:hypothetical protein